MKTKEIERVITETIYISDDGEFGSVNSNEVVEYETKKALTAQECTRLYKTKTQENTCSGAKYSEYYFYRCDTAGGLLKAIYEVLEEEEISVSAYSISKIVERDFSENRDIYIIRAERQYAGTNWVRTYTPEEVANILTKDKKDLQERMDELNSDMLGIGLLLIAENR